MTPSAPSPRDLKALLYEAIVELEYVQCAEDHSLCASAKGKALVKEGMALLGLKDLSADKWEDADTRVRK